MEMTKAMKLIDTNVIIWWLENPYQLPEPIRQEIENPTQSIYYSVASLWEIGIKKKKGKLKINDNYLSFLDEEKFQILNINRPHVLKAADLDLIHHDPFDRIIIAQAITEGLTIITSDKIFEKYPVNLLKIIK